MKTAVEWLESEMLEHYSPFDNKLLYEAIHKAKEIEKEQIKSAFTQGDLFAEDYFNTEKPNIDCAENYYNETFKQ
jgi:hypothetical protein